MSNKKNKQKKSGQERFAPPKENAQAAEPKGGGQAEMKPVYIAGIALGVVIAGLLIGLILVVAENNKLRRETTARLPQTSEESGYQERNDRGGDADRYADSKEEGEEKDSAQTPETEENKESGEAGMDKETVQENESKENTVSKDDGSKDSDSKDNDSKDNDSKDNGSKDNGSRDNGSKDNNSKDNGSKDNGSKDKDTPSKNPAEEEAEYLLTFSYPGTWESGDLKMCTAEFSITNRSKAAVNGWTLVLEIEGLASVEGWNGSFSMDGDRLTITNADYNGAINPNGAVYAGCNLGAFKTPAVRSATLNGKPCSIMEGRVDQNDQNNQGGQNNGSQGNGQTPSVDVAALLERAEDAVQGDDWLHTDGNKILDKDGRQVWLTGVNWFGYNTGTNTFDGLWNSKLEPTVSAIADHGFNLIRVPISAQLINQWAAGEYPRANYNNAYNPALNDMNSLEIFDYFLTLAEGCGIKVMPDIHSAETDASGHNVNLWYTSRVSVEQYYAALEWMAERYKDNDTIIAFDLKNEPHGKPNEGKNAAIWNNSKDANNWKYVAETAAAKVLAKNPNVLILVEGTEIYPKNSRGDYSSTNSDDYYFNWWGGNLRAVRDFPIDLGKYQNKLVYSPHDYGPTVYEQPWFKGGYTYDSLMKDCWRDNWLYIQEEDIAPLLIGEWGGFMREPNLTWMTYMRQLIQNYHLNHTFWCLNANSGDTGGLLLDDFTTWDQEKYNFVKEVLWQENGKFVGLDHAIPLGENGITTSQAKGL